jgi:hypothetical protein
VPYAASDRRGRELTDAWLRSEQTTSPEGVDDREYPFPPEAIDDPSPRYHPHEAFDPAATRSIERIVEWLATCR